MPPHNKIKTKYILFNQDKQLVGEPTFDYYYDALVYVMKNNINAHIEQRPYNAFTK